MALEIPFNIVESIYILLLIYFDQKGEVKGILFVTMESLKGNVRIGAETCELLNARKFESSPLFEVAIKRIKLVMWEANFFPKKL